MAFSEKCFKLLDPWRSMGPDLNFARDQKIMEFERIYERPFAKQT